MASKKISYVSGRRGGNLGDGNSKIPGFSYQVKQSQLTDSKQQQQQSQLSDSNFQPSKLLESSAYLLRSGSNSQKAQLRDFYLGLSRKAQQKINGRASSMGFRNFSFLTEKNLKLAVDLAADFAPPTNEKAHSTALPACSGQSGQTQTSDQGLESKNSKVHKKTGLLGPGEENFLKNVSGTATGCLEIIAEGGWSHFNWS